MVDRKYQQRGQRRRDQIVSVANELLEHQDIETLRLKDIAKAADIPLSSFYHFYPNMLTLLTDLTEKFSTQLGEYIVERLANVSALKWQQLVKEAISATSDFYKENYAYQQLILTGKAPSQIKQLDRQADSLLAVGLAKKLQQSYVLADIPNQAEIFFNAVEIVDLFLALDVQRENQITAKGEQEALRACLSYLRCYLPEYLMFKEQV